MRKIAAVVVIVIVLAGGAYALVKHNNDKNKNTGSSYSSSGYGSTSSSSSNKGSSSSSQSPAINNAIVVTKTNSSVGAYLAEPSGQALYTYGADSNGVSNCTAACLSAWPAYVDTGATTGLPANFSTIKRTDNGQVQFTYKGKPLYTFVSDGNGQVTGNGVSNFSVAKP